MAIYKVAIPKSIDSTTHSLFPAGLYPTRVFLGLLESGKAAGTQESSPFEFYRKWPIPKGLNEAAISRAHSEYNKIMKTLKEEIKEELAAAIASARKKQKGKKLQKKLRKKQPKKKLCSAAGPDADKAAAAPKSVLTKMDRLGLNHLKDDRDLDASDCTEDLADPKDPDYKPSDEDESAEEYESAGEDESIGDDPDDPGLDPRYIWLTKLQLQANGADIGILISFLG